LGVYWPSALDPKFFLNWRIHVWFYVWVILPINVTALTLQLTLLAYAKPITPYFWAIINFLIIQPVAVPVTICTARLWFGHANWWDLRHMLDELRGNSKSGDDTEGSEWRRLLGFVAATLTGVGGYIIFISAYTGSQDRSSSGQLRATVRISCSQS
jgi:hypothetical protein